MRFTRFAVVCLSSALVLATACSVNTTDNGTSQNGTSPDSCAKAKEIADTCNAQPSDGGAKLTVTFDQDKCEGSDQGKTAADCIVANPSNCDCILSCSLKGSCP